MIRLSHDGIAAEADYRDVSRRLIAKRQLNDAEWERMTGLFMRDMMSETTFRAGDRISVTPELGKILGWPDGVTEGVITAVDGDPGDETR